MSKPKLLFMCVVNSCRSQMAEALARHHLGERFEIYSAGSAPTQVNQRAIQVLKERELDTSQLQSKSFDDACPKPARLRSVAHLSLVIAMQCASQKRGNVFRLDRLDKGFQKKGQNDCKDARSSNMRSVAYSTCIRLQR